MPYITAAEMNLQGDIATYNLRFLDYRIPAAGRGEPGLVEGIEWLTGAASLWRARMIEKEIPPQADCIRYRNRCLEECGGALAQASAADASLEKLTDKWGRTPPAGLTDALAKYTDYRLPGEPTKADLQKACQHLKNAIDLMDNDAQTDMMRLQSLISKRDQAFEAAAEFLDKINGNLKMAIAILAE